MDNDNANNAEGVRPFAAPYKRGFYGHGYNLRVVRDITYPGLNVQNHYADGIVIRNFPIYCILEGVWFFSKIFQMLAAL